MKNKLIINEIRLPITCTDNEIINEAVVRLNKAGINISSECMHIHKKSIDARRKDNITFVCSVIAETDAASVEGPNITLKREDKPETVKGEENLDGRPIIIGFGPAGIFCAIALSQAGLRPIVFERGCSVDKRIDSINSFYNKQTLDVNSNIQFGAGGAGTFSDGKLTTRIGDYRCSYVLENLHSLGAPDDILWRAKPHVGTDVLRDVVRNADKLIRENGGEILYETTVTDIADNYVIANGEKYLSSCIVIACGHSSRDTYQMLYDKNFAMEAKPFSVGVRVEHLQEDIDRAMYGKADLCSKLGHAEYQLSYRKGNRGVYSFCMCPGGEVVAAASEEGTVVTNGMSRHARDGKNANAAIAVSVLPEDFNNDPLQAIAFQRKLERAAFNSGGRDYSAPCQSFGAFESNKRGTLGKRIKPTYMNGRVHIANLNNILPQFAADMLKVGIHRFGSQIKGFDAKDVPMTGLETRTSAPLRIMRDDKFTALGHNNIYPCGEGAGYAGGIMSAAVDGLRVAEAILARFSH